MCVGQAFFACIRPFVQPGSLTWRSTIQSSSRTCPPARAPWGCAGLHCAVRYCALRHGAVRHTFRVCCANHANLPCQAVLPHLPRPRLQMLGAVVKRYMTAKLGLAPEDVCLVSFAQGSRRRAEAIPLCAAPSEVEPEPRYTATLIPSIPLPRFCGEACRAGLLCTQHTWETADASTMRVAVSVRQQFYDNGGLPCPALRSTPAGGRVPLHRQEG